MYLSISGVPAGERSTLSYSLCIFAHVCMHVCVCTCIHACMLDACMFVHMHMHLEGRADIRHLPGSLSTFLFEAEYHLIL